MHTTAGVVFYLDDTAADTLAGFQAGSAIRGVRGEGYCRDCYGDQHGRSDVLEWVSGAIWSKSSTNGISYSSRLIVQSFQLLP